MPLWYRFDLNPAWATGHGTRPDRLILDARSDTEHDQVVELLTLPWPASQDPSTARKRPAPGPFT
jgi:hypothetical protein